MGNLLLVLVSHHLPLSWVAGAKHGPQTVSRYPSVNPHTDLAKAIQSIHPLIIHQAPPFGHRWGNAHSYQSIRHTNRINVPCCIVPLEPRSWGPYVC